MGHNGRIFFLRRWDGGRREGKEKWWTKDGRRGRRRRRVDAFVDYSQRKGRFWRRGLGIFTLLQDQKFIFLTSNPTMFLGYWNGEMAKVSQ